MPPLIFGSHQHTEEEEIEIKKWTSSSFQFLLTDHKPAVEEKKSTTKNLKRTLSLLQYNGNKKTNNSRRSKSTILFTNNHHHNHHHPQIEPQPLLFTLNSLGSNNKKFQNKKQKALSIWKNKMNQTQIQVNFKGSTQLSKFIMNELLTTEETYLSHLLTIKNFYMDPLMESAKNPSSKLVNLKEIETIFLFIPELIAFSSALIPSLEQAIFNHQGASIGKIFYDFEPFFEVYIAYAINYSKSTNCLKKSSSNIKYRQLIKDTLNKKGTNKLLLSDYMIEPIQRITRYCLLLTDLLKHTSKSSHDYVYLVKALKSLSALAYAMNEIQ